MNLHINEFNSMASIYGKTHIDASGFVKRLPLICHLTDTAAVAEYLLKSCGYRRCLEGLLGHYDSAEVESIIQKFAALSLWHDFGKFSPYFQRKMCPNSAGASDDMTANHIQTSYELFGDRHSRNPFETLLKRFAGYSKEAEDTEAEDAQETALRYRDAVIGHHASVVEENTWRKYKNSSVNYWLPENDTAPVEFLEILLELTESWFPHAFDPYPLPFNFPLLHFFNGILMLSDKIASDYRLFPFCGDPDLTGQPRPLPQDPAIDPLEYSRRLAEAVLSRMGWNLSQTYDMSLDFSSLFGFHPNAMQQSIWDLQLQREGELYILESETGSGKTEAAMALFAKLTAAGLVDGIYFANPMRSAALQIFNRFTHFSDSLFGKERVLPVLAVPGYLQAGPMSGIRSGWDVQWLISDQGSDIEESRKNISGWAAQSTERYLAAPLSIGTTDQALMSVLNVRHAEMRSSSLSRSLLVIDEVHSSDEYMSSLIADVVEMMSRSDGHVLLMSATLGDEQKQFFIKAWKKGRHLSRAKHTRKSILSDSVNKPYPLLTTASVEYPVSNTKRSKNIHIKPLPIIEEPAQIAKLAASLAGESENGPCVLIIRNTVNQARLVQQELEKLLPPDRLLSVDGVPTVHHSRYAPEDRQAIDKEIEKRFGKASGNLAGMRRSCVAVGTQTLEQSLDIDADVLITDLAPADVLLQRIGRLQRHERSRPSGFKTPQCFVLTPAGNEEWLLSKECQKYGYGKDRAYDNILSVAATWEMLKAEETVWSIPEMNRAIVEASVHTEALTKLIERLPGNRDSWLDNKNKLSQKGLSARNIADRVTINFTESLKPYKKDIKIKSRLGMDNVTVKTNPVSSPLTGRTIQLFTLPIWYFDESTYIPKEKDGSVKAEVENIGGKLHFRVAGKDFYYCRYGLMNECEYGIFYQNE